MCPGVALRCRMLENSSMKVSSVMAVRSIWRAKRLCPHGGDGGEQADGRGHQGLGDAGATVASVTCCRFERLTKACMIPRWSRKRPT